MALQQREAISRGWWRDLNWLDWTGFGLLSVAMVSLCVARSRSRLFWADELLGFTVLRDPHVTHTLRGWWEGADGGGLLYYLTGFVWFRLFGSTLLGLRLLSTAGFLAGIGVIWVTARRFFATPVVAVAISCVFLLPAYVVWQEDNGRFYGLFLACAALAAASTCAAVEQRGRSRVLLAGTACAHACLVGSHLLGVIYSAGLLGALVISDLLEGRRRPLLYGCVLGAWAVVLSLSYHAMRATATVAQGVFWTVRPHRRDLVLGFFAYNHKLVAVGAALLVLMVVRRVAGRQGSSGAAQGRSHRPVAVVVGGLVLGQLAIYAKSEAGLSIYSDRYLLPLTIALVLVLCEGMTRVMGARPLRYLSRPAPALAVMAVSVGVGSYVAARPDGYGSLYAEPGYPAKIEGLLPPGRDVVVTYLPVFTMLRTVDPGHRYTYLTDWAYDGATPGADLSGYRQMENMARGGFADGRVLPVSAIATEMPAFTLLAEPGRVPWLRRRFGRDGGFDVKEVGALRDWYPITIWEVRCLHPDVGCRPGAPPR